MEVARFIHEAHSQSIMSKPKHSNLLTKSSSVKAYKLDTALNGQVLTSNRRRLAPSNQINQKERFVGSKHCTMTMKPNFHTSLWRVSTQLKAAVECIGRACSCRFV